MSKRSMSGVKSESEMTDSSRYALTSSFTPGWSRAIWPADTPRMETVLWPGPRFCTLKSATFAATPSRLSTPRSRSTSSVGAAIEIGVEKTVSSRFMAVTLTSFAHLQLQREIDGERGAGGDPLVPVEDLREALHVDRHGVEAGRKVRRFVGPGRRSSDDSRRSGLLVGDRDRGPSHRRSESSPGRSRRFDLRRAGRAPSLPRRRSERRTRSGRRSGADAWHLLLSNLRKSAGGDDGERFRDWP
jgi:hypothetical protein